MSRPSRAELAAWMVDALDPDQAEDLSRAVQRDPLLQAEVARLRARMDEDLPLGEPLWSLPPPGLRLPGAPTLTGRPSELLGGRDALRVGARFEVELDLPPDPWVLRLVVLTRQEGDWEVVFPMDAGDDLPVGAMLGKGGHLRVGLTAGERPGQQRWALAFVPIEVPIAWERVGADRWGSIRAAFEAGLEATVIAREVSFSR